MIHKKHIQFFLLLTSLTFSPLFTAEADPFADGGNNSTTGESSDIFEESNDAMLYLDAIQKSFWDKNRKKSDNNINIVFKSNETHMIRTRYAMNTTFIFDNDKIASIILGDSIGFELKEIGKNKFDLSNIITIKPKMIGIDTNLIVIGESGKIYQFYLFSTKHTNRRNPAFVVFVSSERDKIGQIAMENLEEKELAEHKKELATYQGKNEIPKKILEYNDGDYITIGENQTKISIKKDELEFGYKQTGRKRMFFKLFNESEGSKKLKAKEIFNDSKWTYFKYDSQSSKSKFPEIYRVVDGYDNPMNYRIVGDYMIVETISDRWTLRLGDEYVCVGKEEQDIEERNESLKAKILTLPEKPKEIEEVKTPEKPKTKQTKSKEQKQIKNTKTNTTNIKNVESNSIQIEQSKDINKTNTKINIPQEIEMPENINRQDDKQDEKDNQTNQNILDEYIHKDENLVDTNTKDDDL